MSEQDPPVPQGAPSQTPPAPPAEAWAAQGPSGPPFEEVTSAVEAHGGTIESTAGDA
ncbi:MAG: hypothetical protein H0T97_01230, partial [Actinobacteria bacterium]|nr:hypothetical protein [Actinomycetota bacterium]